MKDIKSILMSLFILCASLSTQAQAGQELDNSGYATEDTVFSKPYVDIDEWRDTPVHHRYVHGGFKGTETKFSFYFPTKENYEGRFFQYVTPFPDNENLAQYMPPETSSISFSSESGAYFIETNGGGSQGMGIMTGSDPTIGAYRANAACAHFSRLIAEQVYEYQHRPYGYVYGGSGGAYRTVGGIENTVGVWDGAVPMVMGSMVAIPNVFTVRLQAMRILWDKFPQIIDALEPGGSGNMYAGLNVDEIQALNEVTKMGFPPKSWYGYKTMGMHGLVVLYQSIVMMDQAYFKEDFWNKPGYLGETPTSSLLKDRIQVSGKIKRAIATDEAVSLGLIEPVSPTERGTADLAWKSIGGKAGEMPVAFELEEKLPEKYFLGGDLNIQTGDAGGNSMFITTISGNKVVLGPNNDPKVLIKIKAGDEVMVDNSNFLAIQTYHRHQVPSKEFHVWDQYRDSNGNPIYPQRPMQVGPIFTQAASGVLPTGKIKAKVILLGSLWDREAFPWQQDWYRSKVEESLGDSINDYFRLWYTDRALHGEAGDPTRNVTYFGTAQQALRDLSAWVEKGTPPPSSTSYKVVDGQVLVPASAQDRHGIQPTVDLEVNGAKRAEVKIGEPINFTAQVEVPKGTGQIISAEWDFEGQGNFPIKAKLETNEQDISTIKVNGTHTFTRSGTYFCVLRVTSERNGNKETSFALIQNLDRVRVVVE